MKQELKYFFIDGAYGGNQDWFWDYMMKMGGCGAVTACDSCIYFDLYKGTEGLYPYLTDQLTRKDYIRFSKEMKPYLHPRWSGIDTLELYMEGMRNYLSDHGNTSIQMKPFYGTHSVEEAKSVVTDQIGKEFPIPCLILKHANPSLKDYEWHWFLLTGYEEFAGTFMVKAATYGNWQWLDLSALWDTGYRRKGGFVLYDL